MTQIGRPFSEVLIVVTHFISPEYHHELYKIWKNGLYRAPEMINTSWYELCSYINDYLKLKYEKINDPSQFNYQDLMITQILSGEADYQCFVPTKKIKPCLGFEDFQNTVMNVIQEPVIHG